MGQSPQGPELRIGLVLYGGVSLAVYIYGVVMEMQRLLRSASPGDRPESPAYTEALELAGISKATVDVIAGTSAGGINGILLAKALVSGADVGAVRDLWLSGGDIADLLHGFDDRGSRALLRREHFEKKLAEGFERLGGGVTDAPLDLFVSATHLLGDRREFRDTLGSRITTLLHRHVFHLKRRPLYRDEGGDDFVPASATRDARLAKLARATSAFPVAFEPMLIEEADGLLDGRGDDSGWFADGGILNNKPFTEALRTIFARSSDRPVRRWLLSVDPDPDAPPEEAPGPEPAFDQIALGAMTRIPRYQSIARDLEDLERHNAEVRHIEAALLTLEEDLAKGSVLAWLWSAVIRSYEDGPYLSLRNRAWAEEIATQLLSAVRPASPEEFDPDAAREAFAEAALGQIRRDQARRPPAAEPGEGDEGGGYVPPTDLAFERRRVYYLIKLIGMAVPPGEQGESGGGEEGEQVEPAPDLGRVKAALWGEFERISNALWEWFARAPIAIGGEEGEFAGQGDAMEAAGLAAPLVGSALGVQLSGVAPADAQPFSVVRDQVMEGARTALSGVTIDLPRGEKRDREVKGEADGAGATFSVALEDVFDDFESRDWILLPMEVGGGLRYRDIVNHAQISPAAARSPDIAPELKLAGDTAAHFGGFLDGRWRENDLMWGRLDAADILVRTVLADGSVGAQDLLTEAAQREILADERPEALAWPGGWEDYLREHAQGDVTVGRLPKLLGAGLAARAAVTLRRMVRGAREGRPSGALRTWVLRAVDRRLTVAGRLLLPFRPLVRWLARRTEKRDPGAR
jgi:patatin-related protein